MSERFFVAQPITGSQACLVDSEAHHLARVLRAHVGDEVTLFDGSGDEFSAQVTRLGRSDVELRVLSRQAIDRESVHHLTLAVALPKGERQRWLVEKAVELGVARIVPLETRRGVAQPVASAIDRLRRAVVEASKQCGRNRLLEVTRGQSWETWAASCEPTAARWVLHPHAAAATLATQRPVAGQPTIVAIGPEGGFTDDEVALALAAGWQVCSLGPRILRVETAALAAAAWCCL